MTASPTVAPGQPGVTPIPESDQLPPDAAGPTGEIDEDEPRRRRRVLLLLLMLGLLAFLLGLAIWYLLFRQPIPIPVIPGETVMPAYVTSIYGADRPVGVAATPDGSRLFIGETDGERIARVVDAGGTEIAQMLPPLSTGGNHVPVYVATDPLTGEVYVSDRPTGSIYIYDANGTYQRTFTPTTDVKGWQPLGLTFDAAGNLYVSDLAADPQQVLVFDRTGAVIRTIGIEAGLNFPNGIAVDPAGYVYVTDSSNGRLLVFGPDGSLVAQVGRGAGAGNLGLPRGIAIADGRVYVGDATGHGVFVYATYLPEERSLTYLGFIGGQGVDDGQFMFPNGVSVDSRGRIYVADSGNDRIQVWSY